MRTAAALVLVACGGSSPAAVDARACAGAGAPVTVGTVSGSPADELSGVAAGAGGVLWTHGDSGDEARVYALDASDANVVGTLRLAGATATDWEDIATGPCTGGRCIYVADTGDNDAARDHVSIYVVPEPARAPSGAVDVTWKRYDVRYPSGPRDVEAVFVDPRDTTVYGITKTHGIAELYRYPLVDGAASTAAKLATLTFTGDGRVTGADLWIGACGPRLLVRTHDHLFELSGAVDASIAELAAAAPMSMPVADEPQGEAIAWRADGGAYYTVSEGTQPPLHRVLVDADAPCSCAR